MNRTILGLFLCAFCATAQQPAAPAASSASGSTSATPGSVGNAGTNGNRGTFGNTPSNNNPNRFPGDFNQDRPVFLSGNVMFDDGTPANSEIRIERVCNGSSRLEAHADSKGRFSFQVGGQSGMSIADADVSSSEGFGGTRNNNSGLGTNSNSMGGGGRNGAGNMMGCEIRAAYPGYISERVDLSTRHTMDDPRIGTILLHRLSNVKGTTISLTSAMAPKSAQKSYEKGMQLAQKGKFEEAEAKLASATEEYPKYAAAFFDLGRVQQRLNKLDEAKKSYLAATGADGRYVSPYDQLALLAAQQNKWDEAAKYSKQATDLNPVEFASSFWYNALANYNLKNNTDAEKSARALLKLDTGHRYPQAETMLAEFTANRGEYDEAAAHLRSFLTIAPNAKNGDAVKRELARMEQSRNPQAKAEAPIETAH